MCIEFVIYLNVLQDVRMFEHVAQVAILCSYRILNACCSEMWDDSELLYKLFNYNLCDLMLYCMVLCCNVYLARDPTACCQSAVYP